MALDSASTAKFNLKNASILLVEKGASGMEVLVQIMIGFGVRHFIKCETATAAKEEIAKAEFDLMIIGAALGGEDGFELVTWLRRSATGNKKFAPVIIVTPHTKLSKVGMARDAGAHFVVAKPLNPTVLLERILWVAREQRPFVEAGLYVGPDRRFKFDGPPVGTAGRRADDLSAAVGVAKEPNMSQGQIDALMQPRKVSL